jgi:hypothetical protein
VFHDRFVAQSNLAAEKLDTKLSEAYQKTLDVFANMIHDSGSERKHSRLAPEDTLRALERYLQHHYVVFSDQSLDENQSPLSKSDDLLDVLELQYRFDLEDSTSIYPLKQYDESGTVHYDDSRPINPLAHIQFYADKLKEHAKIEYTFKSIPEIAIASLLDTRIEDAEIQEQLKAIEHYDSQVAIEQLYSILNTHHHEDFKPHHKYFAVIRADANRFGDFIRESYKKDKSSTTRISESIYQFITGEGSGEVSLVKLLDDFGGMLIYAGGDDLLAFAPIIGRDGTTLFELVETIDARFKSHLGDGASLSFGVSIRYYKSPMIESIKHTQELLRRAKRHHAVEENQTDKRSAIAVSLTKHSGQSHDALFYLGDTKFEAFKRLFGDELSGTIQMPHSIHLVLERYRVLIVNLFENDYTDEVIDVRMKALSTQLLQDDTHSDKAREGLTRLTDYVVVFAPKNKELFQSLVAQLAIIKFLRGDQS